MTQSGPFLLSPSKLRQCADGSRKGRDLRLSLIKYVLTLIYDTLHHTIDKMQKLRGSFEL